MHPASQKVFCEAPGSDFGQYLNTATYSQGVVLQSP